MVTLKAYGKINLSLDVTGRRENGYHDISTIMQSVALCDVLTVKKNTSGAIQIHCDSEEVPCDERNIAYKACKRMMEIYNISDGFDIDIQKNIPVAGGMAGGSTNAAAVIRAVNALCELNLTVEELMQIGVQIGADVPFCIQEETALATGIGEVLTPVSGLGDELWIVLVNPGVQVSTKSVYEAIDETAQYGTVNNEALVQCLKENKMKEAYGYMVNIMEPVSSKFCPQITDVINALKSAGAKHAMMSGSGATCFGVFTEKPKQEELEKVFPNCFVCITKPLAVKK